MEGETTNNTSFSDMGVVDIETGVALHRALNLTTYDLQMPETMRQINEIADFMNQHPDAVGTINRVVRANKNPNITGLDHMLGFVALSKQKLAKLSEIDVLNNELKFYE